MRTKAKPPKLNNDDEVFGYKFGVDGLMLKSDACQHLAIGKEKFYTLVRSKQLRAKRHPGYGGRTVACRRSVENYKATMQPIAVE